MRFPLTSNFYYQGHKSEGPRGPNLVFELAFGPPWVKNYFGLYAQYCTYGVIGATGYRNSVYCYNSSKDMNLGSDGTGIDFGFDLGPAPVSVNAAPARLTAIYPNPTTSLLRLSGVVAGSSYQVSDFSGRSVLRGNVEGNNEIPVTTLPAGNYLLQINSGESRQTMSFTKQ